MPQIKVGDRVKSRSNPGEVYRVTRVRGGGWIDVQTANGEFSYNKVRTGLFEPAN